MADLLVNLLKLPNAGELIERLRSEGITIRRAHPFELAKMRSFVETTFSLAWADEASVGFAAKPVTVFLAVHKRRIVGFAAYECTRRNFFGPIGVAEEMRGMGIGQALLIAALMALYEMGYAYAIIGAAGPGEFYERSVGAVPIANSGTSIYTDLLD